MLIRPGKKSTSCPASSVSFSITQFCFHLISRFFLSLHRYSTAIVYIYYVHAYKQTSETLASNLKPKTAGGQVKHVRAVQVTMNQETRIYMSYRTITMVTSLVLILYLQQLLAYAQLNDQHSPSHLKFIVHTSNPPSLELQCACVSTGGL